jgi:tetratricopeptide (TPR) repeat protein
MHKLKIFGIFVFVALLVACQQKNHIGRYIADDDTSFPADIISASKKINANPSNPELHYLRGNAFYFLDRFNDAEIDFTTAIKLDSNNALYNYKLGDCILKMDTSNSLRATGHLERAILLKPNYLEAMNTLATLYVARQEYDKAEELLKTLTESPDFSDKAWIMKGIISKEKGDTATAIVIMQRASQVNPSNTDAVGQIASMYLMQNNPLAKDYYKKILAIDPYNYDAYYHLGLIAQREGKITDAEKMYSQVKSIKRDYVFAWYNLAVIYMQQGRLDQAMEQAEQAVIYNPNYSDAWALQGFIYEKKGELGKASMLYKKALGIDPNHIKAKEGLANIE